MNEPVAKRRPMIDLDEFERRLRQPAPPRKEDDPLVELAKLGDHENDPFKTVFEAQPMTPDPGPRPGEKPSDNLADYRRQDPAWEEQLGRTFGDDFSAIEAGLRNSSRHEASPRIPKSHYGGFVDHTATAESWQDDTEDNYAEEFPAEKRSRKPLYIMAGIVIIGLIGIGGTFALKSMRSGQHEVALIKADSTPSKIQPPAASNKDIAAQDDSILQKNNGQAGAAGLKNNSEQPVDLSQLQAQEKPPRVISLNQNTTDGGGAASVPVPAPPQASQTQPQYDSNAPLSIAALIEPKKVKTISVRPDGTILPNDTPPPVPPSIAPVPVPRPSSAGLNPKASTPKTAPRPGTTPKTEENGDQIAQLTQVPPQTAARGNPPAETANAQESGEALTNEAHSAAGKGGFSVQLAAPPTEQEARAVQIKLLKQYADVLSGHHSTIRRAGTADKPIYRVRVGANLTREEATELCQKVQSKGGTCFVAKN